MGIYAEKRDKIAARIVELTKRISEDTAKKKELEEKLKEANRLAMAEQRGCKPRKSIFKITSSKSNIFDTK